MKIWITEQTELCVLVTSSLDQITVIQVKQDNMASLSKNDSIKKTSSMLPVFALDMCIFILDFV